MEQLYRLGFENYLQEQLDLRQYDNLLKDSELHFLPAQGDNITEQQRNNMSGMKYLYIRNDIYLDRLTKEDYALLKEVSGQFEQGVTKDSIVPREVQDMIERTFHDIISPNEIREEEDEHVLTSFDTTGSNFFTNNSIVIYIATQEAFDENGEYIDEESEQEKKELLEILCSQMESDCNGVIEDTPVRVFSDVYY